MRVMVLLLSCLLPLKFLGAGEDVWTGIEKIVAVGDVHGNYLQLLWILRTAGIINQKNRWIGGTTHLVQIGDVVDRGPHSKKAMDLLMSLEEEAPKAGGMVHCLIGNHEAMVLMGDLRYVHPGEYAAFGGKAQFLKNMSPWGKYGEWIRSHNTVIKINNVLFVHGGISRKYADLPLRMINQRIREELQQPREFRELMSSDSDGPLWYRGFSEEKETSLRELLDTVLSMHQASHIVIGHTITQGDIETRLDARIIEIDVGMFLRKDPAPCLVIEKGKFQELRRGKRRFLIIEKVKPKNPVEVPP